MKTIMKLPVYIEIDSENVDRKFLSEAVNLFLYPELVNYIGKASIRNSVKEKIREHSKSREISFQFLTELNLFERQAKT